jgi:hypothetical protein
MPAHAAVAVAGCVSTNWQPTMSIWQRISSMNTVPCGDLGCSRNDLRGDCFCGLTGVLRETRGDVLKLLWRFGIGVLG